MSEDTLATVVAAVSDCDSCHDLLVGSINAVVSSVPIWRLTERELAYLLDLVAARFRLPRQLNAEFTIEDMNGGVWLLRWIRTPLGSTVGLVAKGWFKNG